MYVTFDKKISKAALETAVEQVRSIKGVFAFAALPEFCGNTLGIEYQAVCDGAQATRDAAARVPGVLRVTR